METGPNFKTRAPCWPRNDLEVSSPSRNQSCAKSKKRDRGRLLPAKKKGAGGFRRHEAREMRSGESDKSEEAYLLSAMGLAPKSRRLLAAVRAARAAGRAATAAP
jgi:hypothetical protein